MLLKQLFAIMTIGLFALGANADNQLTYPNTPHQDSGTFAAVDFTGPYASTQSLDVEWTRNGNIVSLKFPSVIASCSTATSNIGLTLNSESDILGTDLTPPDTLQQVIVHITNNGSALATPGYIQIGGDGTLSIKKDGANTNFSASGNCGFNAFSVTYSVL